MIRQTRIVATLGPATESPEMLGNLMDAGVDVFRLNMSHAKYDWVRRVVLDLRSLAAGRGKAIGILLDTQGPSIRTGDVAAPIVLKKGDRFSFVTGAERPVAGAWTTVNYDEFARDVTVGTVLVVDNGEMKMRIVSKTDRVVECEVLTEGTLGSRRHINLPGVWVSLPALTQKDREDVKLGLEVGVDYIALSFVRSAKDVEELRSLCQGASQPPQIVAKIEHQFAVNHFEAIAREADAIMVARGDLGIECPYQELPIIQRRIVKGCAKLGKPVIVATHMLESMVENPLPTRAEITDVANAVFEQADAIMLSGETTVGRHPLACIEVMDTIARRIERSGGANYQEEASLTTPRQKLVKRAVQLADDLRAAAILVFTRRGHMPRYAAWMRPRVSPIYAVTDRDVVARALTLCRGVVPLMMPVDAALPEESIESAIRLLVQQGRLHSGDTVVAITTVTSDDRYVDGLRIRTVE